MAHIPIHPMEPLAMRCRDASDHFARGIADDQHELWTFVHAFGFHGLVASEGNGQLGSGSLPFLTLFLQRTVTVS